jgi:hypothetical protein
LNAAPALCSHEKAPSISAIIKGHAEEYDAPKEPRCIANTCELRRLSFNLPLGCLGISAQTVRL